MQFSVKLVLLYVEMLPQINHLMTFARRKLGYLYGYFRLVVNNGPGLCGKLDFYFCFRVIMVKNDNGSRHLWREGHQLEKVINYLFKLPLYVTSSTKRLDGESSGCSGCCRRISTFSDLSISLPEQKGR